MESAEDQSQAKGELDKRLSDKKNIRKVKIIYDMEGAKYMLRKEKKTNMFFTEIWQ